MQFRQKLVCMFFVLWAEIWSRVVYGEEEAGGISWVGVTTTSPERTDKPCTRIPSVGRKAGGNGSAGLLTELLRQGSIELIRLAVGVEFDGSSPSTGRCLTRRHL